MRLFQRPIRLPGGSLPVAGDGVVPLADSIVAPARREKLTVVSIPDLPDWQKFPPPKTPASEYRQGTVVRDERGVQWRCYWDTQDHQLEWQRVDEPPLPPLERIR